MYWNKYETKNENKNTPSEWIYLWVLIYSNQDDSTKRYKSQRYYLPNSFIKNYVLSRMLSSSEKGFYDQVIDSDIKRYEEIRKLTTG